MSILLKSNSNVLVQGMTGKNGTFHTLASQEYGTNIVAGVTPGKGGTMHCEVPVYNTVSEALKNHKVDVSVIFVPPPFAAQSIIESAMCDVPLIVCITEGIPVLDMCRVSDILSKTSSRLIGPNCPGIIVPDGCRVGIMPGSIHKKGSVGIVSRSGTLTYEAVVQTTLLGMGQSTCIGIGGDPVKGLDFVDVVDLFLDDDETEAIVVVGEIGGNSEEVLADFLKNNSHRAKPILAYVSGITAPKGKRMGHAGAIIEGSSGLAQAKIDALRDAGCVIAKTPIEIGESLKKAMDLFS